jgi:hypothetical protein
MSDNVGYERDKCEVKISPKCEKNHAAYQRRPRFAQKGPWLSSCETCARVPYEQPEQFQKNEEDPANGF